MNFFGLGYSSEESFEPGLLKTGKRHLEFEYWQGEICHN